ncbi:MAG TPA: hypothetical protein VMT62_09450 [Syntrophorhabdaceae bacterium]|nr:hypothetical protein [Syntrophorhabdaceae bacterium]
MILHVQYQDDHYDYVGPGILEKLLKDEYVRRFYRPSEKRWVDIVHDPIRGIGGDYGGPERRKNPPGARVRTSSITV